MTRQTWVGSAAFDGLLHQRRPPAVLDHSRTLPQGDGGARPAFTGGEEGGERDLIVLDASHVLCGR